MLLTANQSSSDLIAILKEQPSAVQISGTRHQICLSFEDLSLYFPVVDHIYTRWICRLQDVRIEAGANCQTELTDELLLAIVQAAMSRPYSSFDLEFKE